MIFKKVLKSVEVEAVFGKTWLGLQWAVVAVYECKFWCLHWVDRVAIAGSFSSKEEAKQCAKKFRKTHKL